MKRISSAFLVLWLSFPVLFLRAQSELVVQSAGAPYAPLQVVKNGQDPNIPMSASQRQELLGEFKGLVHMGMQEATYEAWAGKEMADCVKSENPQDSWAYRCEIMTGQGSGYYYFYRHPSRQATTLRELDIRLFGSDQRLLDDFRRPVQDLFGRADFVDKTTVPAKPTGQIRRWNNGDDIVELFMDRAVRPEGSVRFVWKRY